MTKIMLWPDLHREDGHWLPAVSLAKSLIDAGYQVEAMGIPDTEAIVSPYQIAFNTILEEIFPLGTALKRVEKGVNPWDHLLPIARGELDPVFTGAGAPNVLVAGYFAALEALIVHHKYGVPLVVLTTFLRAPQLSPHASVHEALLAMPDAVRSKLIETTTAVNDTSIEEFLAPLLTAPEMIPMDGEFDFKDRDWRHVAPTQYVEPMVDRVRMDGSALPAPAVEYYHPLPATGPLIYGACGSQVEVFETSARNLYLALIEMMKGPGMSEKHLVLSVGQKLYKQFRREFSATGALGTKVLPPNVSLAAWVPQPEILARAEVVFIHGGLATIKETISAQKPLVIVPMINDQFDNALRVERSGVGVMVPVQRLTPSNLRAAYTKVTSSPWYARAAAQMKTRFTNAESQSPKPSVAMIQAVVAP